VPGAQDMIQAGQWGCLTGRKCQRRYAFHLGVQRQLQHGDQYQRARAEIAGRFQRAGDALGPRHIGFVPHHGRHLEHRQRVLARAEASRRGPFRYLDSGELLDRDVGESHRKASPSPRACRIRSRSKWRAWEPRSRSMWSGSQVGSFADPGLFSSGQMYFGFNVSPGDTLNVLAWRRPCRRGRAPRLSALDLAGGQSHRFGTAGLRGAVRPADRRGGRCSVLLRPELRAGAGRGIQPDCPGERSEVRGNRTGAGSVQLLRWRISCSPSRRPTQ
jgi:hypothetical protein